MLSQVPEWLTESRAAIAISLVAAAFTGMTLKYTRRLALNDTEKMRRTGLIVEFIFNENDASPPGWQSCDVVIRNLEPLGARVEALRVRRKNAEIVEHKDAFVSPKGGDPFARPVLIQELEGKRELSLNFDLKPVGTQRSRWGTGDTCRIGLFSKGVEARADLELVWEWADGQKR